MPGCDARVVDAAVGRVRREKFPEAERRNDCVLPGVCWAVGDGKGDKSGSSTSCAETNETVLSDAVLLESDSSCAETWSKYLD